jgi:hypothetical protein
MSGPYASPVKKPLSEIAVIDQESIDIIVEAIGTGDISTFESVSKNLNSCPYVITYDGDDIDYITYDIGGGDSIVKTFNYTLGVLTSLVLSGDTPSGIDLTKTFGFTGDDLTSVTYS